MIKSQQGQFILTIIILLTSWRCHHLSLITSHAFSVKSSKKEPSFSMLPLERRKFLFNKDKESSISIRNRRNNLQVFVPSSSKSPWSSSSSLNLFQDFDHGSDDDKTIDVNSSPTHTSSSTSSSANTSTTEGDGEKQYSCIKDFSRTFKNISSKCIKAGVTLTFALLFFLTTSSALPSWSALAESGNEKGVLLSVPTTTIVAAVDPSTAPPKTALVIETTGHQQQQSQEQQSILKAKVDGKALLESLVTNKHELNSSFKRIVEYTKAELEVESSPWIEVGREIFEIEGDVLPDIKVKLPTDWQGALKDLSAGKLEVFMNGEVLYIEVKHVKGENPGDDEIIVRIMGRTLPEMIAEGTSANDFTKSNYGGGVIGASVLGIALSYAVSYQFYLDQIAEENSASEETLLKKKVKKDDDDDIGDPVQIAVESETTSVAVDEEKVNDVIFLKNTPSFETQWAETNNTIEIEEEIVIVKVEEEDASTVEINEGSEDPIISEQLEEEEEGETILGEEKIVILEADEEGAPVGESNGTLEDPFSDELEEEGKKTSEDYIKTIIEAVEPSPHTNFEEVVKTFEDSVELHQLPSPHVKQEERIEDELELHIVKPKGKKRRLIKRFFGQKR